MLEKGKKLSKQVTGLMLMMLAGQVMKLCPPGRWLSVRWGACSFTIETGAGGRGCRSWAGLPLERMHGMHLCKTAPDMLNTFARKICD